MCRVPYVLCHMLCSSMAERLVLREDVAGVQEEGCPSMCVSVSSLQAEVPSPSSSPSHPSCSAISIWLNIISQDRLTVGLGGATKHKEKRSRGCVNGAANDR